MVWAETSDMDLVFAYILDGCLRGDFVVEQNHLARIRNAETGEIDFNALH